MTPLKNHHPVCFVQAIIELGLRPTLEMFLSTVPVGSSRRAILFIVVLGSIDTRCEKSSLTMWTFHSAQQLYPEHERIRYIGGIGVTGAWITVSVKEDRRAVMAGQFKSQPVNR